MKINLADLQEWTGYKRRADIVRWLDDHSIPWWPGKDGEVCTTLEAINSRLVGAEKPQGVRFG